MNKWITALERRPLSRKLAVGFALLLLGTIAIGLEGIVQSAGDHERSDGDAR